MSQGVWKTIRGAKVLIENGVITKGPAKFVGKTKSIAEMQTAPKRLKRRSKDTSSDTSSPKVKEPTVTTVKLPNGKYRSTIEDPKTGKQSSRQGRTKELAERNARRSLEKKISKGKVTKKKTKKKKVTKKKAKKKKVAKELTPAKKKRVKTLETNIEKDHLKIKALKQKLSRARSSSVKEKLRARIAKSEQMLEKRQARLKKIIPDYKFKDPPSPDIVVRPGEKLKKVKGIGVERRQFRSRKGQYLEGTPEDAEKNNWAMSYKDKGEDAEHIESTMKDVSSRGGSRLNGFMSKTKKTPLIVTRNKEGNNWGKYAHSDGRILVRVKSRHNWNTMSKRPKVGKLEHNVGKGTKDTLRHEYGHKVWYEMLSSNERSKFGSIGSRMIRKVGKSVWSDRHPVSQYAGTNIQELYAESFSAYTHPNYKEGSLPAEIESFLKDTL